MENDENNQQKNNSTKAQIGLLRDPIWQFIGSILASIAIILSIILFYSGQPQKSLKVFIDTSAPLVNVNPEATGEIEVLYKGTPVGSAFLIQLHIINSGNQAILETDFSRNIIIDFDSSIEIVDYLVTASEPKTLD
jgi:hypothetical protein